MFLILQDEVVRLAQPCSVDSLVILQAGWRRARAEQPEQFVVAEVSAARIQYSTGGTVQKPPLCTHSAFFLPS